jgi:hypothetical protein
MPDTKLQGEEAKAEYRNFHMCEGFFDQGDFYNVGVKENLYTRESFQPVVEYVSPEAMKHVAKSEEWRQYTLYAAGFVIAMATASVISQDQNTKNGFLTVAGGGLAFEWVTAFISVGHMQDAAKQYNQDLYKKVVPSVGVKFNY